MATYLEKEMNEAGYRTTVPVEGILLVHDFITDEEVNKYFEIINSATEKDWEGWDTNNLKTYCLDKFGRDDVEK